LIYSDFEQVVRNLITKLGKSANAGQNLLIVHRNRNSIDGHQVEVTKTPLIERVGNVLKVGKIDANEDSVIDVRLDVSD
jgi:hypothetical protein